jgi:hypothetical protein
MLSLLQALSAITQTVFGVVIRTSDKSIERHGDIKNNVFHGYFLNNPSGAVV